MFVGGRRLCADSGKVLIGLPGVGNEFATSVLVGRPAQSEFMTPSAIAILTHPVVIAADSMLAHGVGNFVSARRALSTCRHLHHPIGNCAAFDGITGVSRRASLAAACAWKVRAFAVIPTSILVALRSASLRKPGTTIVCVRKSEVINTIYGVVSYKPIKAHAADFGDGIAAGPTTYRGVEEGLARGRQAQQQGGGQQREGGSWIHGLALGVGATSTTVGGHVPRRCGGWS